MGFWENLKIAIFGEPKAKTIHELRTRNYTPRKLLDYGIKWFIPKDRKLDIENFNNPEKAFEQLQARDDENIKDAINCDDESVVYFYCLDGRYYCSLVYVANSQKDEAHAFCMVNDNGTLYRLDNWHLALYPFWRVKDIIHDVYSKPKCAFYMRWNGSRFVKGEDIPL